MPVSAGEIMIVPCAFCGGSSFRPALNCEGFSFVRCAKCSLVQRNPQPAKDEIILRYSSTFGKDYLAYEIENEKAFFNLQTLALNDVKFNKLEKHLFSKNTRPSFLDIGCATGALLVHLSRRGWNVTGVEISPASVYARERCKLNVYDIPLEEINFPENYFDVVHASHLIEHLNNPDVFLSESQRILKPNGSLFITTPNIGGFQARLFGGRWRSAIFDHLYLFSKRTLRKMLKAHGLIIESCRTWGGLAAGTVPNWLKKTADVFSKRFGCGDVMIIKCRKPG